MPIKWRDCNFKQNVDCNRGGSGATYRTVTKDSSGVVPRTRTKC